MLTVARTRPVVSIYFSVQHRYINLSGGFFLLNMKEQLKQIKTDFRFEIGTFCLKYCRQFLEMSERQRRELQRHLY